MDIPVYAGPAFVGWITEDDAREVLKSGDGRLLRKVKQDGSTDRRIILKSEVVTRVRALCNTSTQSALSSTQREELYSGLRKDHTDGPVTKVITVIRKVRVNCHGDRSLENWREGEKFPRRRFNPDRIPTASFRSEAEYHAAQARAV